MPALTCCHPGRIILKSRGLHVVVIGSSVVVAVASRPAARNRNRQLGQPMSNVRHIRRRTFAVFSTLYPTFMPSSLLISVSLSRFFSREIGRLQPPSAKCTKYRHVAPHVPNTAIYIRRSDFPLYRETSHRNCRDLYAELFEIFEIQSIAREFTRFPFNDRIIIVEPFNQHANRETQSIRAAFYWNFVSD